MLDCVLKLPKPVSNLSFPLYPCHLSTLGISTFVGGKRRPISILQNALNTPNSQLRIELKLSFSSVIICPNTLAKSWLTCDYWELGLLSCCQVDMLCSRGKSGVNRGWLANWNINYAYRMKAPWNDWIFSVNLPLRLSIFLVHRQIRLNEHKSLLCVNLKTGLLRLRSLFIVL